MAAVQRAGARSSPRTTTRAAARAGPVPGDLRLATSTSSSWSGSPASSAASPPASPCARPPGSSRARCSSRSRSVAHELHGHAGPRSTRTRCSPALRGRGHHDRPLGRAERRRAGAGCASMFRRAGLPGADAAGRRPGAPVPLHLRALAQPRRRAGQPQDRQGALRPGQGAAAAAPAAAHRARGRRAVDRPTCTAPGSCRSRTSSPPTSTSSSPAWRCASTTPSGSPATRTSRSRRTTPRTSCTALEKELTRRRFGPPVRLEVDEDIDDHVLDLLVRELGVTDVRGLPAAGPARPARPQPRSPTSTAPTCATRRSSRADAPATSPPAESAKARGHLRRSSASTDVLLQHPYDSFSTSVQAFIEQAAADPQRARHQADALPHQRRLPHRRRPHRRRRGRQAGAGHRRDQGALRRAEQHLLGPQARAGRRPRRLRHRRAQDPRQALPGRPPGEPTACAATATSAPATTTPRPPASTRTSACSPPTRRSARTSTRLFNQLSGFAPRSKFKRLLVAPRSVRSGLIERIDAEIEHAEAGRGGLVQLKVNSIVDEQLIDALYRASQAGVHGRHRGCAASARCARACPGLSENIGCARSSAGSSSTRGSSSSAAAASPRSTSAAPT